MQADSSMFTFNVPVGSAKKAQLNEIYPHVPSIKYLQDDANIMRSSSLVSDMLDLG